MGNTPQTNEVQEWWDNGSFKGDFREEVERIVAEAERRGERKAWEEAREMVEQAGDICITANILPPIEEARRSGAVRAIRETTLGLKTKIDAKLNALK